MAGLQVRKNKMQDRHKRLELRTFFIAPEFQGKGMAKTLFGRIKEEAISLGADTLNVQSADFDYTMKLYLWLGFIGDVLLPWYDKTQPAMRLSLRGE